MMYRIPLAFEDMSISLANKIRKSYVQLATNGPNAFSIAIMFSSSSCKQ